MSSISEVRLAYCSTGQQNISQYVLKYVYIIIYYNVSSISEDRLLNRTGKSKHESCRRDEIRVELSLDQKESIRVIFNKRNRYHHHLFIISGAKGN